LAVFSEVSLGRLGPQIKDSRRSQIPVMFGEVKKAIKPDTIQLLFHLNLCEPRLRGGIQLLQGPGRILRVLSI
jgi:hypothetical protein